MAAAIRISGAGADLSLVVNFRAAFTQINFGGKGTELRHRRGVKMITVVRKIRHPAEAGTDSFFCQLFHCSVRV